MGLEPVLNQLVIILKESVAILAATMARLALMAL